MDSITLFRILGLIKEDQIYGMTKENKHNNQIFQHPPYCIKCTDNNDFGPEWGQHGFHHECKTNKHNCKGECLSNEIKSVHK